MTEKVTGRRSAVIPLVWGMANAGLAAMVVAFGGGSLEGGVAGGATAIILLYAFALFTSKRRETGATTVVQPVATSGWAAFFLGIAMVLLGMAFPFGAWTAVVAPVPLFVAGYLWFAPRRATRQTLAAAMARAVENEARGEATMGDEERKAAYLATEAAGVQGQSPLVAQAMMTRPAPPPSYARTEHEAAISSGAAEAAEAEARRRTRRGRLARAGRAATATLAAAILARRRRKNKRSWE